MTEMKAPETKAELTDAFADYWGAFNEYKSTNDRRLKELERKASADVLDGEKLARIDAAMDAYQRRMDDMELKAQRPAIGGAAPRVANEHKSAFHGYMRGGEEAGLRALEKKALTAGASDAGFTVPVEIEAEVMRRLGNISPIRSIASVRQVSSGTYRKPVASTGPETGWVAETAARPQTTASMTAIEFPTMELYAMPAATSVLLDDAAVDLDQWLADEIETAFAEQEGAAFVQGNGTSQPKGFMAYNFVDEGSWAWDSLGTISTGVNGAFPTTAPADKLIDLVYTLKAGYRQNGTFVMNRTTQSVVRKMKDGAGDYLWTPPAMVGGRAGLLNFQVVEAEEMPDIATGEKAIAFGDFRRGYLVVDRQGVQVLRDPFSAKPYVLFYVTKRVGGGVQDFDAIKFLDFSA